MEEEYYQYTYIFTVLTIYTLSIPIYSYRVVHSINNKEDVTIVEVNAVWSAQEHQVVLRNVWFPAPSYDGMEQRWNESELHSLLLPTMYNENYDNIGLHAQLIRFFAVLHRCSELEVEYVLYL